MLTPTPATQAEIDALATMLRSGVLSASHNGKTMTFRSLAEVQVALDAAILSTGTSADVIRVIKMRRRYEG